MVITNLKMLKEWPVYIASKLYIFSTNFNIPERVVNLSMTDIIAKLIEQNIAKVPEINLIITIDIYTDFGA